MENIEEKYYKAFLFTKHNNNYVTLKGDNLNNPFFKRYKIVLNGKLFCNNKKVAVKCINYPSNIEVKDIEDIVFPSNFNKV